MINIDDLTVLNDIRERLALITQQHIDACARGLTPKEDSDKVAGVVRLESTRAMFALSRMLMAEKGLEKALAATSLEPETTADHEQRAMIADGLADVVTEMQWFQARSELGFWRACSLGIRAGWELVEVTISNPLRALFGGPG